MISYIILAFIVLYLIGVLATLIKLVDTLDNNKTQILFYFTPETVLLVILGSWLGYWYIKSNYPQ